MTLRNFKMAFQRLQKFPFERNLSANGVGNRQINIRIFWCLITYSRVVLIYVYCLLLECRLYRNHKKYISISKLVPKFDTVGKWFVILVSFLVVRDDKSKFILLSQLELYQHTEWLWIEMENAASTQKVLRLNFHNKWRWKPVFIFWDSFNTGDALKHTKHAKKIKRNAEKKHKRNKNNFKPQISNRLTLSCVRVSSIF